MRCRAEPLLAGYRTHRKRRVSPRAHHRAAGSRWPFRRRLRPPNRFWTASSSTTHCCRLRFAPPAHHCAGGNYRTASFDPAARGCSTSPMRSARSASQDPSRASSPGNPTWHRAKSTARTRLTTARFDRLNRSLRIPCLGLAPERRPRSLHPMQRIFGCAVFSAPSMT